MKWAPVTQQKTSTYLSYEEQRKRLEELLDNHSKVSYLIVNGQHTLFSAKKYKQAPLQERAHLRKLDPRF